jgi:NACHT domain
MALIETLTLGLAGPAIKLLAGWVLPDSSAGVVGDGLAEFVDSRLEAFEERRKARRFLEDLQDEVGKNLASAVESLFPRISQADLNAATLTVGTALGREGLAAQIVHANLDPDELYERVRTGAELDFTLLGGDAKQLAEFLLRRTCYYLVRLADKLPDFRAAWGREVLVRSAALSGDMRAVLDAVNALTRSSSAAALQNVEAFEQSYRLAIIRGLERLQLFGVKLINEAAGNYPLSVAYVALSAKSSSAVENLPVQEALVGRNRLLLKGEAGSGKTTLMQWLAVRSASMDFPQSLAAWSRLVPVYIRLRDHAKDDGDFPAPEAMLQRGVASNVAGLMPAGWMHAVLGGRALVLLDGADELPSGKRRRLSRWMDKLLADYPSVVCIVSSRPAALDLAELPAGFDALTLEPMRLRESEQLVLQWHEAVSTNMLDLVKLQQLERSRLSLQSALPSRPALRALASNPLLCAMMCALNWHFSGQIPSDRMTLYQSAIDLLVSRRDDDREIESELLRQLGPKNSQEILDRLAYWMMRNGLSEAPASEVVDQLARLLPRYGTDLHPQQLLQALLERSGILRQPEHNVIGFVHNTFMEFMGARAAVVDNDFGLLADHAQQERWREAVVFAVGHARGGARDRLVKRLLERPLLRLGQRAVQSDITVVCAMETGSKDLDPRVLTAVLERASLLFPPATLDGAWSLAPAAAARPELLVGHQGAGDVAVAGCVRCACVIGGSRMLAIVGSYAAVDSPIVRRQLFEGWSSFEGGDYGLQVISKTPWFGRLLKESLDGAPAEDQLLQFLELLCYRGEHSDEDTLFESCRAFIRRREATLGGSARATQSPTDSIRELLFERKGRQRITALDLDRLQAIPVIRSIRLRAPVDARALEHVKELGNLLELRLDTGVTEKTIDWKRLNSLSTLAIQGENQLSQHIGELPSLRTLVLAEGARMEPRLVHLLLQRLEWLAIAQEGLSEGVASISSPTLSGLVLLGDAIAAQNKLDVSGCPKLRFVVWVARYPVQIVISAAVKEVTLGGAWVAVGGDPAGLESFVLQDGRLVEDGAFLKGAVRLSRLIAAPHANLSPGVESTLTLRGVQLTRSATAPEQHVWRH